MITMWWASLSLVMKILWGITIAASLVFVIQSVLTFVGADSAPDGADMPGDIPADADLAAAGHAGMNLYTFRNFVNFCLGFGWTAVLFYDRLPSKAVVFVLAFIVGAILVAAVMWLFKWLYGMQQSGNIDVFKSAAGCSGTVYLTVPGGRKGEGKVQISISGAVREYNAVTDGETIPNGTPITVTGVLNAGTLIVNKSESK